MRKTEIEEKISKYLMESYDKLYRLAYSYVKNKEDAMDVVQESAYKAIRSSAKLKNEKEVSSWVYQIVVHTALDTLRKKTHEVVGIEEYEGKGEMDRYEDSDLIQSLFALSEEERSIVILRYFEEQKLRDIAVILKKPENSIKSKLYRALKKLKIELSPENGGYHEGRESIRRDEKEV